MGKPPRGDRALVRRSRQPGRRVRTGLTVPPPRDVGPAAATAPTCAAAASSSGLLLGVVAPAPEIVRPHRPDDRRAGVLRHHRRAAAARATAARSCRARPRCRRARTPDRRRSTGPASAGRPARRAGPSRVGQGLFAEKDHARIGPQQLVEALRIAASPVLDRRATTRRSASSRPGRSASARPSGTAARCGRRTRAARRARCRRPRRRAGGPSPAPAAPARRAGRRPTRFVAAQRGLGVGMLLDLLARAPGLVRDVAGRRPQSGVRNAPPGLPPRLDQRLEIAGREALRLAAVRFEAEDSSRCSSHRRASPSSRGV